MRNHFEFGASELSAEVWLRNKHFYVAGNRRPVKRERSKKISPLLFFLYFLTGYSPHAGSVNPNRVSLKCSLFSLGAQGSLTSNKFIIKFF